MNHSDKENLTVYTGTLGESICNYCLHDWEEPLFEVISDLMYKYIQKPNPKTIRQIMSVAGDHFEQLNVDSSYVTSMLNDYMKVEKINVTPLTFVLSLLGFSGVNFEDSKKNILFPDIDFKVNDINIS